VATAAEMVGETEVEKAAAAEGGTAAEMAAVAAAV